MDDRAVLIERAKLAEVAERYDDMAEFLKSVIEQYPKTPLNDEERNSFSVAYKNKVGARRSSWRCIAAAKRISKEVLDSYRTVVVKELNEICDEVLVSVCVCPPTRGFPPGSAPGGMSPSWIRLGGYIPIMYYRYWL
jgi:hypothetical protein